MSVPYVVRFEAISLKDLDQVGGKNASLGEMIQNLSSIGIKVPPGFATTAEAYQDFIHTNGLGAAISKALQVLDVDDVKQLAQTGAQIREWILTAKLQPSL